MSTPGNGHVKAGIRVSFINTVLAGVIQFVLMAVLAHVLHPSDYGEYALCYSIMSLSVIFVTNVSERLQVVTAAEGEARDETPTIALLCVIAGIAAVLICSALNHFGLTNINIRVLVFLCFAATISSAAIPPRVVLRRQIRFTPIAIAETSGLVLGQGAVAITLALAGWGPFAIAAGVATQNLVIATFLRFKVGRLPVAWPSPSHIARHLRSSVGMGSNVALEILNGQVAPLVLGDKLGAFALGLFNRTYSLIQMPIQLLVNSMSRVMISALFMVSEHRERMRAASRKLVQVAALIVTPVAAGIAGSAHNFVFFAFGPHWIAAQDIVPALALSGWATMMATLFGIMTEALQAFAQRARLQAVSTASLVALAIGGSFFGLIGAAVGIALSSVLFLVLYSSLAAQLLEIPYRQVLGWLMPGVVTAAPCLGVSLLIGGLPLLSFVGLVLQICACGVVDAALMLILFPALTLQLLEGILPPHLFVLRFLRARMPHLNKATSS